MDLEEGLRLALDGRAILFIGAGFSRGATNLEDLDFALGSDLSSKLCEEATLPKGLALEDAAELYVDQFGEQSLINHLKLKFTAKTASESQKEIARTPWRRVYTTNYDDVFELACSGIGKRLDLVTPLDDSSQVSKKNLLCVHLNGSIRRIDSSSVWSDLKLTQASYDGSSAMDSEWGSLFRADLQAAQAIFFVGYSLFDIDIRRLLFEEQLKDKSFFALGPGPQLTTAHRASKYGLLIASGVDEFASQLVEARKHFVPEEHPSSFSFCLRTFDFNVTSVSLEDRNIFDLLLFGKVRSELIAATYLGQANYCCPRAIAFKAFEKIESGNRVVILHSSLGNGKTVTLEALKYLCHSQGHTVFTLANRSDSLAEEIQTALIGRDNSIFFIDNYVEWLDVLPFFGSHRSENFRLVMSARSSSHDLLTDRISKDLKTDDIVEIGIDILEDGDLEWLIDYFDEFGLWGDNATLSRHRKMRYLKTTWGGEWHSILLKLLDSPHIVEKLESLFGAFRKNGVYREPIIRLLVLAVLAYRPPTSDLIELCGDKILETGFRKDSVAEELIEFGKTSVGIRSSVIAEILLKQVADPNLVIQAVIGLLRRADDLEQNPYNRELFKSLIRFSNFHIMLPDKDRGRAGMRIYEAVKHLKNCKKSPLFWLQYAIASLVAQNFERAKTYFDNSYAFAAEIPGYDTHQIDNHYARFLIERALHNNEPASAMTAFRDARVLIFDQLTSEYEKRHYPYRVASGWGPFYVHFREFLSEPDIAEIRNAASYVQQRIHILPIDRSSHRSVVECEKAMRSILKEQSSDS